jgi:hypothetical protein
LAAVVAARLRCWLQEAIRHANEYSSDVENTQDALYVKAVLWLTSHCRNTIVGLSLLGLSPIFKGQHCSQSHNKGDPKR